MLSPFPQSVEGQPYGTRSSCCSNALYWPVVGGAARRAGLHRRDHRSGDRHHLPAAPLRGQDSRRRHRSQHTDRGRREFPAGRCPRWDPAGPGQPDRICRAAATGHGHGRCDGERGVRAQPARVDVGRGGGNRLRHAEQTGCDRFSGGNYRAGFQPRGDLLSRAAIAWTYGRGAGHHGQRRTRSGRQYPHPGHVFGSGRQPAVVRGRRRAVGRRAGGTRRARLRGRHPVSAEPTRVPEC